MYEKLYNMKKTWQSKRKSMLKEKLKIPFYDFATRFTYDSISLTGNSLTYDEVKCLLEKKVSVGGKDLKEIYEVLNHKKAIIYLQECLKEKEEFNKNMVRDVHTILMQDIKVGGIYKFEKIDEQSTFEDFNNNEEYTKIKKVLWWFDRYGS